ncbi:beta-carotene 15,15'-dioxygenase, Brp/Blh family [Geodermatophilus sabuli]|uniref:Probable beta-carotene 15,15'-dioxygenase n=1 Tax=Geodermatophilus sabuli TaxID=1564158 RepID=A0A7K3VWC1_9ACTN|nr:beta-carotene 15,15'-dioxygenase, Brp/Blh family [Geodermatophilus sabuli]
MAATVAALGVGLVAPGAVGSASWAVLLAGLLLGLPHGAVDHLLPARRLGLGPVQLAALAGGYAALAVLAYLAFRWAPGPGLAVFVALSVWHFGSGETAVAHLRAGVPVRRRAAAALVVGAVVLVVPLARPFPDAAAVVGRVVPDRAGAAPLLPGWTVPAVIGAAALLGAALLARRRLMEAGELALLTTVVLVLPPPAALGVYFGAWHSTRHVARVVAEDPRNAADLAAGRAGPPLGRFARAAALPTAVAGSALALLAAAGDDRLDVVAALLPVLAALTVPHALVVGWLDRVQGPRAGQAGSRRIGRCGMPSST